MPLTYIDIEKQKSWRIGIFFLLLLIMYFLVAAALVQGVLLFLFPFHFIKTGVFLLFMNPIYLLIIFGFSLVIAAIHFWFSAFNAVGTVMKSLEAIPPDQEDGVHRRLMNIVDEIHVVTGNKAKIECMVIPSLSMNAIAVCDLKGKASIAITEGLLSRLSRSQTEAVIAHETYHILSGDCLEATVATSLFGMYAAMLDRLQNMGDEDRRGLHPAFFIFWLLVQFGSLISMFVSREREYRADAAAVRMTRDPLSLAEALHLIARNWKGAGSVGSGLEMLCIMNPQESRYDESEGFWANLWSTHPPIQKRIDVLLKMVRISRAELDRRLESKSMVVSEVTEPSYFVLDQEQEWQGPFSMADLASLSWLTPQSWIGGEPGKHPERASENPSINRIFSEQLRQAGSGTSPYQCPVCRQHLLNMPYERTRVYECHYCRGILVENTKIPRIIVRTEKVCTERLKSLAKAVATDNQRKLSLKRLRGEQRASKSLLICPGCQSPMMRTFYSLAYLIEIDRCNYCNLTWFDADELEMLQYLIENRITPVLNIGT